MPEFNFRARVVYDGVVVVIYAENEAEARKKAEQGDWSDTELFTADRVDWTIGRLMQP